MFISDLHRRSITDQHVQTLLTRQKAQLVLLGGDITEAGASWEGCVNNVTQLRKLGPVVAVYGNHDYKADVRALGNMLREHDIKVLENEAMRLESATGEHIWLVGLDDIYTGRANIKVAMEEPLADEACTVLLVHDPIALKVCQLQRVDLMLSGHTHGGQICVPFFGPIKANAFYRRYLSGWYEHQYNPSSTPLKLFISSGFGTAHWPFRLNCRPEAHFIVLRASSITE
ncbi:metallophosphoesterase [Paenibacillus sp. 481]|nr:metallophosphoesterase [Paenibacillus sp. 481]